MLRLFLPYSGYYFFQNHEFFLFFFCAENFNYLMIKKQILHAFRKTTSCGIVDKIYSGTRKVMSSNPAQNFLFIFKTRKYLTIEFKFFNFLGSLDKLKVLIWVIISEFYMAWRNNFTKIFTYRRV